jgi:PilZ domain-containing protein
LILVCRFMSTMREPNVGTIQVEIVSHVVAVSGEARRSKRFPLRAAARVSWSDASFHWHDCRAHAVDLSATGFALLIAEPLPLSMQVHVILPTSGVIATGQVRNCQRRGNSWRIGVELEGPFPEQRVI